MMVFGQCSTMLTEFLPMRPSNGVAAQNLVRALSAAVASVIARPLLDVLKAGPLMTILAGITFFSSIAIILSMWKFSPKWRMRHEKLEADIVNKGSTPHTKAEVSGSDTSPSTATKPGDVESNKNGGLSVASPIVVTSDVTRDRNDSLSSPGSPSLLDAKNETEVISETPEAEYFSTAPTSPNAIQLASPLIGKMNLDIDINEKPTADTATADAPGYESTTARNV
jgi:hypothetical protein